MHFKILPSILKISHASPSFLAREASIQKIIAQNDPQIPPDFERDYPTVITVQIFIVSFASISEATMVSEEKKNVMPDL
ncbi:hypothetical protein PoB_000875600 [Plakobranchus ocellatus]|uniref:Uncharacterized protein n=1 Tax=Plakobranchus ocellatus TaxID=259542 RepID=A0AAV3Y4U3_9GAST|nr:hypothetical protein PoB_000875600 [Plakobranchus ocellatus]